MFGSKKLLTYLLKKYCGEKKYVNLRNRLRIYT